MVMIVGFCFLPALALLFSATFRKRVEKLARDILADPVRVVQGEVGEVECMAFVLI